MAGRYGEGCCRVYGHLLQRAQNLPITDPILADVALLMPFLQSVLELFHVAFESPNSVVSQAAYDRQDRRNRVAIRWLRKKITEDVARDIAFRYLDMDLQDAFLKP